MRNHFLQGLSICYLMIITLHESMKTFISIYHGYSLTITFFFFSFFPDLYTKIKTKTRFDFSRLAESATSDIEKCPSSDSVTSSPFEAQVISHVIGLRENIRLLQNNICYSHLLADQSEIGTPLPQTRCPGETIKIRRQRKYVSYLILTCTNPHQTKRKLSVV